MCLSVPISPIGSPLTIKGNRYGELFFRRASASSTVIAPLMLAGIYFQQRQHMECRRRAAHSCSAKPAGRGSKQTQPGDPSPPPTPAPDSWDQSSHKERVPWTARHAFPQRRPLLLEKTARLSARRLRVGFPRAPLAEQ